ncbi:hypothetical protein D3C87_2049840 [compost metagenome]
MPVKILQADEGEILGGHLVARRLVDTPQFQSEFGVVDDVEPGQQRMLLEHDPAVGAGT